MVVIFSVLFIIVGILFSDDTEFTVYTRGLSHLSLGINIDKDTSNWDKVVVLKFDLLFLFVSFKFTRYGR